MAQPTAPSPPQQGNSWVDRDGKLTGYGQQHMLAIWRQIVAGFVIVPCTIAGTNAYVLTPKLHKEGAASYGDGMTWVGQVPASSTGAVTVAVGTQAALKGYVAHGITQANAGDLVINQIRFFTYWLALDSGAGGFVIT